MDPVSSKATCDEHCVCNLLPSNWPRADDNLIEICVDSTPGMTRKRWGRGFTYMSKDGCRLRCPAARKWIEALSIPPRWHNVWITGHPSSHILARGKDDDERYQYIYHPNWISQKAFEKYHFLRDFGYALPSIREAYNRDMGRKSIKGRAALALALIDCCAMRVGSLRSAERRGSYGAITLKAKHIITRRQALYLRYTGKGGQAQSRTLDKEATIGRALKRLASVSSPTKPIFCIGSRRLTSGNVRQYLRSINKQVLPKDFRTWHASVKAFSVLWEHGEEICAKNGSLNKSLARASHLLGNTEKICRTSYVHPKVIDALKGEIDVETIRRPGPGFTGLSKLESDFLRWID